MTQTVIHPIPPLYNKHSRVLLLGSIPSGASRAAGFFYAHPRNRFWQVIPAVFNETLPSNTTDSRKQFALAHQIALWDVLHSCEINGAADNSIRNPVPNDLNIILENADVQAIFTTGRKAYELYRHLCLPMIGRPAIYLPSTSPANCAISFDRLVSAYRQIVPYLTVQP